MYSKTLNTNAFDDPLSIESLYKEITRAEAVVIGAGSGLSSAAGLTYSGKRFERNFADFIEKYHFQDMYSATFYPYASLEEYWAYMSRHIYFNRYRETCREVYPSLLALVKNKNYFVITTNVDHCFQKAGFHKQRLFYTQGDYGLWQCSKPCSQRTYDNKESILQMVAQQQKLRIPTHLIPRCPVCGRPMSMNLRCDETFVEDEGWRQASERYMQFIRKNGKNRLLFLELGVGNNTPGIIKYPFWKMTKENKKAVYACINNGEAIAPPEIQKQSVCINGDIRQVLTALQKLPCP